MKILDLVPDNCKNCYKCVRNCSVKAIKMVNDKAMISEDKCIACGKCFLVCPQNARFILSDLDKVKEAVNNHKKVIVSIAPSYLGLYKKPYKLISAIKKLGIEIVEETSVGATKVTELYRDYISNNNLESAITSCCPSVNMMIQTYYPEILNNLLPIDSPMIAHCKMIRERYGSEVFITFIGPCLSKKCEAFGYQQAGVIDAVISFEALDKWLEESGIQIESCDEEKPDLEGRLTGQKYPTENGILSGLKDVLEEKNLTPLTVAGPLHLQEAFEAMKNHQLKNVCIEANCCENSCIGGPLAPSDSLNVFVRNVDIQNKLNNKNDDDKVIDSNIENKDYRRSFRNKKQPQNKYTEEQIRSVLEKTGKHCEDDELNCGACGYETCREKAISVLDGMSYTEMCIPYMRSKAERLSNIIFEYSPNILLITDKDLNIIDLNPVGEKVFNANISNIRGQKLDTLIPTDDYLEVLETEESIISKKISIEKYNLIAYNSIIYLPRLKILFSIFLDITDEENRREKLINLKLNTIETADKLIEKQMRVAQEIAGLLGETTAETKTALLKLKKVVMDEESDVK